MNAICGLFRAIAGGIDLAAEVLCPMDHTGARRAGAVKNAHAEPYDWDPFDGRAKAAGFVPVGAVDDAAATGAVDSGAAVGEPAAPRDQPCACGAGYRVAADCPWCRNDNAAPSPEPEQPKWGLPVNDWIWPNGDVLCPKCTDETWTVATMNGRYVICATHGQIAHR